jgi:SWI/SNF-related matrix-associated actin-dependent regulator 1 of chromatin subfamily A
MSVEDFMDFAGAIKLRGGKFVISFPYDPYLVDAVKNLPLAQWDWERRVWTVPVGSGAQVQAFASEHGFSLSARAQQAIRAAHERQVASRATDGAGIEIPAPPGLAYLPYQKAGIAFAMSRPSTLLADEMGLGKTIQAIGVMNADKGVQHVLVIAPASLKLNWKREIDRWSVRPAHVCIGDSTVLTRPWLDYTEAISPMLRDRCREGERPVYVLILHYDILHRFKKYLRALTWDILIADEAHYLKNAKSRRSIMVYGSREMSPLRAKRTLFLTGTPIANRPAELFPLVHHLDPQSWGSFWRYAHRYCDARETFFGYDFRGASNLAELQTLLRSTVMVRRLKKDVLAELPTKRRQVIELPAEHAVTQIREEKEAYARNQEHLRALRAAVRRAKVSASKEEYVAAVKALKHGVMATLAEMSRLRKATAIAKVPQVLAHLHDALDEGGHKVVLFAHHREVIDKIAADFGDKCVTLTGDTPPEERQANVDRFQSDPNCVLFIGSITAAGVGITLTASSHVVFAELDWVPGNMSQCEDRCHRIGQQESVLVQHLVLEGSLDCTMARTLITKQEIIESALDREEAEIPSTPDEDDDLAEVA